MYANGYDEKEYVSKAFTESPVIRKECAENGRSRRSRTWSPSCAPSIFMLGCDGIARDRDRVSTDHFLSELDKTCCREKQVNKGGNT